MLIDPNIHQAVFIYPKINPIAFHVGPLAVRWYGLMYLFGFCMIWLIGRYRIATRPDITLTNQDLEDALFYGIFGTVIGGRLGYVLFYKPAAYFAHPLTIFYVWQGGMSFHGGLIGVTFAMWLFARSRKRDWLAVTDFIAPLVPIALGAGRIGNFINGELWGRPTHVPWAMIYPQVDNIPRHPSELYEFALEGVLLFIIMWWFSSRRRPRGAVSALFLMGYGIIRFLVEFTRAPDAFLGLLWLGLSMGQWLSLPMIVIGVWMMIWSYRRAGRPPG